MSDERINSELPRLPAGKDVYNRLQNEGLVEDLFKNLREFYAEMKEGKRGRLDMINKPEVWIVGVVGENGEEKAGMLFFADQEAEGSDFEGQDSISVCFDPKSPKYVSFGLKHPVKWDIFKT